ncbi:MAG: hypothetical protein ACE5E2_04350 [Candidatus Binatia bacterium]
MFDAPRRSQIRGAVESWAVFLLIGLLLSSCTATTGTRIPLSQPNLTKIKTIGIIVKKEEEFSVRLSREKMTGTGAILFGLIGAGIEAATRASADEKLEEKLKPIVGDYDPTKLMDERLHLYLQSAKVFSTVVSIDVEDRDVLKGKALDAFLEVMLKQWGLRLCLSPGSGEQVQVGLNVHGRMFLLQDGSTVWERDELYLDGECHAVGDFRSREGLLKDVLARAIDNLSGRIVNNILFP